MSKLTSNLLYIASLIITSSTLGQTTLWVDDSNCPGPGTGTMSDPMCSIQRAIDSSQSGNEIIVKPGIYNELINFVGKAVYLHSSDGANVTTIDSTGLNGSVVTCINSEGLDTILEGFTIAGGTGSDIGIGETLGGGMYNDWSNPTVNYCTFTRNFSGSGGGMYNSNSSPIIAKCTFDGNVATHRGGGVLNHFSGPSMSETIFTGNEADTGGAIFNYSSDPTLTSCLISQNMAIYDGGGMYNSYSEPTMINCVFDLNESIYRGGAMYNDHFSTLSVDDTTFSANTSERGGAMYNDYDSILVLMRCIFIRNTAVNNGGAIYNYGSDPLITMCEFLGNLANYGAGMFNYDSSPTITNSTFRGNSAITGGGGIFNSFYSETRVRGVTFSGNKAGQYGGALLNNALSSPTVINSILWFNTPDEIRNFDLVSNILRFSNILGGIPPQSIDGGGNIDVNPFFHRLPHPGPDGMWGGDDDDYGDLRLYSDSPCIDTADPGFIAQPGETDLDGQARVLCGRLDMGAYEFGIGDCECGVDERTCKECINDGDCDDRVTCTSNICNTSINECVFTAVDSNCDNGLFCDGIETCDSILDCQLGTAVECADTDDCTIDTCDEANDSCSNVAADTDNDGTIDCNDGCPNDPDKTEIGLCGCGVAEGTCGGCEGANCCPVGSVVFDPPKGVIDARYPFDPDDVNQTPSGISTILMQGPPGAHESCWTFCETASSGVDNDIASITENAGIYTIELIRPITTGACSTLTYTDNDATTSVTTLISHPSNVNADGIADDADVVELLNILNGSGAAYGAYSSDVNHTGKTNVADMLAVIDLLNGANLIHGQGPTDAWMNTLLPSCAACAQ